MELRHRFGSTKEDTLLPLHSTPNEDSSSFYLTWMRSIKKLIRSWCREREQNATHSNDSVDAHLLYV